MAKADKTGPKEFICPGCGAVMKNTAFSPITETCGAKLVDGWLCKDCASKLRIKYPMYYEKDKKYFYEKKGDSYVRVKSEDGGRPVLTAIKNELFYTDEYSIIDNSTTSYTEHLNFDPLAKLTSSQVRTELASIGSYREETRREFAGAKNAFEVLEVMNMPKLKPLRVGLPNIKRYKGAIAVAGIVRLGAFRKGDVVEIRHGDETLSATILTARESRLHLSLWLYPAYASASGKYPKESNIDGGDLESDRAGILEGMHAIVILSPQAAGIVPGDAITLRS